MDLHNKISGIAAICIASCFICGITFAVESGVAEQVANDKLVLQDYGQIAYLVPQAGSQYKVALDTVEALKEKTGIDLTAPGVTTVTIQKSEASPKLKEYLKRKEVCVDAVSFGGMTPMPVGGFWPHN